MDEHPRDDIESFALGALSQPEAEKVLLHADACSPCAVLLADAFSVAEKLAGDVAERPVRHTLAMRSALSRNAVKAPPRQALWPALAFVAAAAAVMLGVWNLRASTYRPVVPIALLVHSHFEHHALHGALGNAKVLQALDGSWIYLLADGLSPRTTYQLWEEAGRTMRPLGTFASDAHGQVTTYWKQQPSKIRRFVLGRARKRREGPVKSSLAVGSSVEW